MARLAKERDVRRGRGANDPFIIPPSAASSSSLACRRGLWLPFVIVARANMGHGSFIIARVTNCFHLATDASGELAVARQSVCHRRVSLVMFLCKTHKSSGWTFANMSSGTSGKLKERTAVKWSRKWEMNYVLFFLAIGSIKCAVERIHRRLLR